MIGGVARTGIVALRTSHLRSSAAGYVSNRNARAMTTSMLYTSALLPLVRRTHCVQGFFFEDGFDSATDGSRGSTEQFDEFRFAHPYIATRYTDGIFFYFDDVSFHIFNYLNGKYRC